MDAALFNTFLQEQREALVLIERTFFPIETDLMAYGDALAEQPLPNRDPRPLAHTTQLRFDDVARRLADAYMICNDDQRASIRRLRRGFPGVQAALGVSADQIRLKIDAVRFRLALIYESIKDLEPRPEAAVENLAALCAAARKAGIEINPLLEEIADVSNDIDREGYGSMAELLLDQRERRRDSLRCPICDRRYQPNLPECPYCGAANPRQPVIAVHAPASSGTPATPLAQDEGPITLPTRKLLAFAALSWLGHASTMIGLFLILTSCCMCNDFFTTFEWWTFFVFNMVVSLVHRYFGYGELAKKYSDADGRSRVVMPCGLSLIYFGSLGVIAVSLFILVGIWSFPVGLQRG